MGITGVSFMLLGMRRNEPVCRLSENGTEASAPADFAKPPCQETKKVLYSRYAGKRGCMSVVPETIVENCPRQISKVKGGFIMQISKEMLIGELLQVDENMAQILMGAGMHCIGCPSSQMESLEEACMVHGIPVEKLVSVINEYLAQKQQ